MKKFIFSESHSFPEEKPVSDGYSEERITSFVGGGGYQVYDTFEQALNAATDYWRHLTYNEQKQYRTNTDDHFYVGMGEVQIKKYSHGGESWSLVKDDFPRNSGVDIIVDFKQEEDILNFQLRCYKLDNEQLSAIEDVLNICKENDSEDFDVEKFEKALNSVKEFINLITAQRTGTLEDYLEGVHEAREKEPISIFNIRMKWLHYINVTEKSE